MDDGVLCDDTVFRRVSFNDLEFHCSHATTDEERVTLANRAVSLEEIGLEVNLKDIATEPLNRVVERKYVNTFPVFNLLQRVDVDKVAQFAAKVVTRDLVDLDLALIYVIRAQADENGVSPLLAPSKRELSGLAETWVNAHT